MLGRIRRRRAEAEEAARQQSAGLVPPEDVCPLCQRPIPLSQRYAHHLVPKSKGGVRTVFLHRICHRQVHALFTEVELAQKYHEVEALRAHPAMARFIAWVRLKPNNFFERTRKSANVRAPGS